MQLVLYMTEFCQLCEEAQELIYRHLADKEYALTLVDISQEESLMERYALRIPVIAQPAQATELGWPFDEDQLAEWLATGG